VARQKDLISVDNQGFTPHQHAVGRHFGVDDAAPILGKELVVDPGGTRTSMEDVKFMGFHRDNLAPTQNRSRADLKRNPG
jgi:hypothetical protein